MHAPDIAPTSFFFSAFDGLKLHVREYGPRKASMPPVVCLPGLTRTAEDFDVLARTLAGRGRRVLALELARTRIVGVRSRPGKLFAAD